MAIELSHFRFLYMVAASAFAVSYMLNLASAGCMLHNAIRHYTTDLS